MLIEFKAVLSAVALAIPSTLFYATGRAYKKEKPREWTRTDQNINRLFAGIMWISMYTIIFGLPIGFIHLIWR